MKPSPNKPRMFSVYRGQDCAGFVLHRGPTGYEAFDVDQISVGLFTDPNAAAAAILNLNAHGGLLP